MMSPAARKFMLTAHVLSSIGWFGALLVFLTHSIVSLISDDQDLVRAVCIAMGLTAWFVILPLSLASLMTGVVQAFGTAYGLLRHYWVVAKLLLTAFATGVLLLKLAPINDLAVAAAQRSFSATSLIDLKQSLLAHSVGGVAVLLMVTVLAIYKPKGLTPFANRGEVEAVEARVPRWVRISLTFALLLAIFLAMLALHGGHGPAMHSSQSW